jgi:hypothetical protein
MPSPTPHQVWQHWEPKREQQELEWDPEAPKRDLVLSSLANGIHTPARL